MTKYFNKIMDIPNIGYISEVNEINIFKWYTTKNTNIIHSQVIDSN